MIWFAPPSCAANGGASLRLPDKSKRFLIFVGSPQYHPIALVSYCGFGSSELHLLGPWLQPSWLIKNIQKSSCAIDPVALRIAHLFYDVRRFE